MEVSKNLQLTNGSVDGILRPKGATTEQGGREEGKGRGGEGKGGPDDEADSRGGSRARIY